MTTTEATKVTRQFQYEKKSLCSPDNIDSPAKLTERLAELVVLTGKRHLANCQIAQLFTCDILKLR